MTAEEATVGGSDGPSEPRHESLDEQVRRRGLKPITSVDDLARYDVFETDEEVDAFISHVYAERRAHLI